MVLHDRLVDDRRSVECRYLLKLYWYLGGASDQAVTRDELRQHVAEPKVVALEALRDALARSPEAVDQWIAATAVAFTVIEDRGNRVPNPDDQPAPDRPQ